MNAREELRAYHRQIVELFNLLLPEYNNNLDNIIEKVIDIISMKSDANLSIKEELLPSIVSFLERVKNDPSIIKFVQKTNEQYNLQNDGSICLEKVMKEKGIKRII